MKSLKNIYIFLCNLLPRSGSMHLLIPLKKYYKNTKATFPLKKIPLPKSVDLLASTLADLMKESFKTTNAINNLHRRIKELERNKGLK